MRRFDFRLLLAFFAFAFSFAATSHAGKRAKACEMVLLNQGAHFVTKKAYADPWETGGKILVMVRRKTSIPKKDQGPEGGFNINFERGNLDRFIELNPALMNMYGFSLNLSERHYPDLKTLNARLELLKKTPWATKFRFWNNKSGLEVKPLEHIRLRSQNLLIYSPPSLEIVKAIFHYHELSAHWGEFFLPMHIQQASVVTDALLIAIHDSPTLSKNENVRRRILEQIERRSQNLDQKTSDFGSKLIEAQEGVKSHALEYILESISGDAFYHRFWDVETDFAGALSLTRKEKTELKKILSRYPKKEISAVERQSMADELLARLQKHQ